MSPISSPLAGSGAISIVIIISGPPYSPLIALVVVACNTILSFLILSCSDSLRKILRTNGTNALSRITALLIAAPAVSFVVRGVTDIVTALG